MNQSRSRVVPVVPKARLERAKFDPVAPVRSAVSLFEVPQRRLKPLASPRAKFTSAVDYHWLKRVRKQMFTGVIVTGSIDVVLSASAGLPVALAVPGSFPIVFGIWGILQASFLPYGIMYSRIHRAEKRDFNSLLLWLKGRYNVTLSAKQGIPHFLRTSSRYDELWIADATGKEMRLRDADYNGLVLTDGETGEEVERSPQVAAPKKVKAAAAQLSQESKALYGQINEHLLVLAERQLSPESDHVVNRAARDRDAVVALHGDLVRLNALDPQQEAAIATSFSALLKELAEVVRKETAFALAALNVENIYITSREQPAGIKIQKEA